MKNAIFITVRTGSSRLPQKALLHVCDQPTVVFLMRRLKMCKLADCIILCTTTLHEDDVLCELAAKEGVDCFRGSVEDKLVRWQGAAHKYGVDFFVTADGDDLLCDPELIDMAFKQAESEYPDFLEAPGLACGAFTYGISAKALDLVCEMKDTDETEMMWVYFKETNRFNVASLKNVPEILSQPQIRLTLDYPEDYEFFRVVLEHFERAGKPYGLCDILPWLAEHPEIVSINSHMMNAFLENQKNKTHLNIKTV